MCRINLQPNAVRELYELGIGPAQLDAIGLQTREWALVGLNGKQVYAEPRGLRAGYEWPQYSVHRGGLQDVTSVDFTRAEDEAAGGTLRD